MRILALIVLMLSLTVPIFSQAADKIVIGSKEFTEQFILARMLTLVYQQAGYQVEERLNLVSYAMRKALITSEIDACWDYTGTGYMAYNQQNDATVYTDAQKIYAAVKALDAKHGLTWLPPAEPNNSFVFILSPKTAQQYPHLRKISDIEAVLKQRKPLLLVVSRAFYHRPDGVKKMFKHYGFSYPKHLIKKREHSSVYSLIQREKANIVMGYGTDPQIAQYNLVALEDDKKFFPVYQITPIIRTAVLEKYPDLAKLTNQIAKKLDTKSMIHLNYLVDIEKQPFDNVVKNWLQKQGLLAP